MFILCVWISYLHICASDVCLVPLRLEEGGRTLDSKGWFWVTMEVLGIESGFYYRAKVLLTNEPSPQVVSNSYCLCSSVNVHTSGHASVWARMLKPQGNIRYLPRSLSTLSFETESPSDWNYWLLNLLQGSSHISFLNDCQGSKFRSQRCRAST